MQNYAMYAKIISEYVALSDPGTMKLVYVLGKSPRDWKKTMHQNAVATIFHTQNICHHVWKIVITPRLEIKDTLKCSSDKFTYMVIYILCMENCRNSFR